MSHIPEFKRTNLYAATLCFVFARKKYLEMAASHAVAISLESRDFRLAHEAGTYPSSDWKRQGIEKAHPCAKDLQNKIISSFFVIQVVSIIALVIGFYTGGMGASRPVDYAKAVGFVGTQLVGWATLLELGGALVTWKGQALHELIHPVIFKLLFVPGIALVLIGVVL